MIEKIDNNTSDLVKREVDIALKIIHHSIHAGIGKKTYLRVFLGFILGKWKHRTILKDLLGYDCLQLFDEKSDVGGCDRLAVDILVLSFFIPFPKRFLPLFGSDTGCFLNILSKRK